MHKRDTYILAVSGGVDSVVLLDVLARGQDVSSKGVDVLPKFRVEKLAPPYKLIVAHFDHGIRSDSAEDAKFVKRLAQQYSLEFVSQRVELGSEASEEVARHARYKFLTAMAEKYHAQIVTAHHQDDLVETAIINLMRGTYRKGLTALKSDKIIRPLLSVTKDEIYEYAREHELTWREDSTNASDKYLRNYIRHNITPKLSAVRTKQLLDIISSQTEINREIDMILNKILPASSIYKIPRSVFIVQNKIVAHQIIAWLLTNLDEGLELTKALIENIFWFVRSAKPNKQFKLKHVDIEISKDTQVVFKKPKSC